MDMKSQDAGLIYHLLLLILYIFENYFFSSKDAQRTRIIKQPYENENKNSFVGFVH